MPFVKLVLKPHECSMPTQEELDKENADAGTIWQCDHYRCAQCWLYTPTKRPQNGPIIYMSLFPGPLWVKCDPDGQPLDVKDDVVRQT